MLNILCTTSYSDVGRSGFGNLRQLLEGTEENPN
jgi:hypothetical protein